jgi:hypothetical protein
MKSNVLNLGKLFLMAALTMVVFAGAANPQTERRQGGASISPTEGAIEVGTVTAKSSAVNLKAIGREVAPGVLEVDPSSVRGKRLVMPRGDQTMRFVCIGKWKNGECKGIYIEW